MLPQTIELFFLSGWYFCYSYMVKIVNEMANWIKWIQTIGMWWLFFLLQGSSVPLVVKWADTEKERQTRRAQKAQSQVANMPHADPQQPSLYGAVPMGYVPPYNGYGYQVSFVAMR